MGKEKTMKQGMFEVLSNVPLADKTWEMTLAGDTSAITAPGQFVNIRLEDCYLRRPISVCDWQEGQLTIIYKVVGKGTEIMVNLAPGGTLDVLTGLGNGYDLSKSGDMPLLIGGGAGVPPMYGLAKRLLAQGKKPRVIMGFNRENEIYYVNKFKELGIEPVVTTADGSVGVKGFVTNAMEPGYSYTYCCGPEPMLKAVYNASTTSGQYSFESRMGCGFGACMGCSCQTKYGSMRICKDGPVLEKEVIVW